MITYTVTLLTTINPRTNPQSNEIPHPHHCSVDYNILPKNQKDNHYESLFTVVKAIFANLKEVIVKNFQLTNADLGIQKN